MKKLLLLLSLLTVAYISASCPFPSTKEYIEQYMRKCEPGFVIPDSMVLYVVNGLPYNPYDRRLYRNVVENVNNPTFEIEILRGENPIGCRPFNGVVWITYTEINRQTRSGIKVMLNEIKKFYLKASLTYPAFYINDDLITEGKVLDEIDAIELRKIDYINSSVCKDNSGFIRIVYKE